MRHPDRRPSLRGLTNVLSTVSSKLQDTHTEVTSVSEMNEDEVLNCNLKGWVQLSATFGHPPLLALLTLCEPDGVGLFSISQPVLSFRL